MPTFFDDAEAICLALDDSLEVLDVGAELLNLALIKPGGTLCVLYEIC